MEQNNITKSTKILIGVVSVVIAIAISVMLMSAFEGNNGADKQNNNYTEQPTQANDFGGF